MDKEKLIALSADLYWEDESMSSRGKEPLDELGQWKKLGSSIDTDDFEIIE